MKCVNHKNVRAPLFCAFSISPLFCVSALPLGVVCLQRNWVKQALSLKIIICVVCTDVHSCLAPAESLAIQKAARRGWVTIDLENRFPEDYHDTLLLCHIPSSFELENVLFLFIIDAQPAAAWASHINSWSCWAGDAEVEMLSFNTTCLSLFLLDWAITVFFFSFFLISDNRPIKCIHTTEDTGRIPRCVSTTEPNNSGSLSVCEINTGHGMLGA